MSRDQHSQLVNPVRLRTTLKMSLSKLQFLQEKKAAVSKQQRRQLADILSKGKEKSAKIRVENIIRNDIYVELLEYLELYCDLLLARITMLQDPARTVCDAGLQEAVQSIIYASPYTEVKEITQLRDILVHKYGIEFGKNASSNTDKKVPERITSRCEIEPPSEKLVDLYLCEIAKAYQVPYSGLSEEDTSGAEEKINNSSLPPNEDKSEDTENLKGDGDDSSRANIVPNVTSKAKSEKEELDNLRARFAALKGTPKA